MSHHLTSSLLQTLPQSSSFSDSSKNYFICNSIHPFIIIRKIFHCQLSFYYLKFQSFLKLIFDLNFLSFCRIRGIYLPVFMCFIISHFFQFLFNSLIERIRNVSRILFREQLVLIIFLFCKFIKFLFYYTQFGKYCDFTNYYQMDGQNYK